MTLFWGWLILLGLSERAGLSAHLRNHEVLMPAKSAEIQARDHCLTGCYYISCMSVDFWHHTATGQLSQTAIGYENNPWNEYNFSNIIQIQVPGGTTSVYTRYEFDFADPSLLTQLTLDMRYDDGFVAYLNGVEIVKRNAPSSPTWR